MIAARYIEQDLENMAQNSITDLTMLATTTFDSVISQIQDSCLNFSIQLTPFSAFISLRKTFVKDKSGLPLLPSNLNEHAVKVENTKIEDNFPKQDMANLKTVKDLEKALETIKDLERKVAARDTTISSLENVLKNVKETNIFLEKELRDSKRKYEYEKNIIIDEHTAEMITWRNELKNMKRMHENLQKKFELVTADAERSVLKSKGASEQILNGCSESESWFVSSSDKYSGSKFSLFHIENVVDEKMDHNVEYRTGSSSDFISLAAHWLIPPNLLQYEASSFTTLISHYVTLQNSDEAREKAFGISKEVGAKSKTLFEKYQREYEETCRQS